mmetsp:Transcript_84430/g.224182  ORF Transcript_84430/g.224182 Transcript_84430/m.224182 type:complete len:206 (-) Transcript_84430:153-770(-)
MSSAAGCSACDPLDAVGGAAAALAATEGAPAAPAAPLSESLPESLLPESLLPEPLSVSIASAPPAAPAAAAAGDVCRCFRGGSPPSAGAPARLPLWPECWAFSHVRRCLRILPRLAKLAPQSLHFQLRSPALCLSACRLAVLSAGVASCPGAFAVQCRRCSRRSFRMLKTFPQSSHLYSRVLFWALSHSALCSSRASRLDSAFPQ